MTQYLHVVNSDTLQPIPLPNPASYLKMLAVAYLIHCVTQIGCSPQFERGCVCLMILVKTPWNIHLRPGPLVEGSSGSSQPDLLELSGSPPLPLLSSPPHK